MEVYGLRSGEMASIEVEKMRKGNKKRSPNICYCSLMGSCGREVGGEESWETPGYFYCGF